MLTQCLLQIGNKFQHAIFRGLGEISSDEFEKFIGEDMRLDLVQLSDEESISELMEFYMGANTIDRQNFIRQNLRSEEELEDVNI